MRSCSTGDDICRDEDEDENENENGDGMRVRRTAVQ